MGSLFKKTLTAVVLLATPSVCQAYVLDPLSDPIQLGDQITFSLSGLPVSEVDDLIAFSAEITFDAPLLGLVDAVPNPAFPGAEDPFATFFLPEWLGPGTALLSFAGYAGSSPADGLILTMVFDTLAIGTANVFIAGFYETDLLGGLVEFAAQGSVTIAAAQDGGGTEVIPLPPSLVLFLSAVALLGATRARTRNRSP